MASLTDLTVSVLELNRWLLSWNLEDPADGTLIEIFVSNSPGGPFEKLGEVIDSITSYQDSNINRYAKWRPFYYRLDYKGVSYGPFMFSPERDRLAYYANYLRERALRRNIGVLFYAFIRKSSGDKCSTCFDFTLMRSTDPDCPECFGTGRSQGYLNPVPVYGSAPIEPAVKMLSEVGIQSPVVVATAWIGNYPVVSPGDIMVNNLDRKAWVIESPVEKTTKRQYLLRQRLLLKQLEAGDETNKLVERIPGYE